MHTYLAKIFTRPYSDDVRQLCFFFASACH